MILRSLWLRPTMAHPVRALVTVLGVAIGVASVVSTLLASRAAVASMGADVDTLAGRARLEITGPGGVDVRDVAALRAVCRDALLVPVVEGTALSPGLGDFVRLLGVDLLLDSGVRSLELEFEGGDSQAAHETMLLERGAAISRTLAQELGLKLGDELSLVVHSREQSLSVAALVDPERFGSAWERVVLLDVAVAQELLGRIGRLDRIEIVPRVERDLEVLAAQIRALLPEGYRVGPAAARREEGERLVRALEFNLTALAGVSILVGIVLVATTLATSVVQRRAQIALLRSLGASRLQLARAVLIEAGAIGLVGGVLGVLFGWIGADAAIASVSTTVATIAEGILPGTVGLDITGGLLGLALGFFASLAAAILPLREALRTPPIQALRGEHPESVARRPWKGRAFTLLALLSAALFFAKLPPLGDRPVWALIAALCILSTLLVLAGPLVDLFASLRPGWLGARAGVPMRLAQAALEAGRRRAAWAAAAVGVAVGLAVAMTTMVGSFRTSVIDWTTQAMPSDLYVHPLSTDAGTRAGRIDPELVEITRRIVGSENVDPFHESKAYFRDVPILLGGAEFAVVAREGGVPFLDGRAAQEVFRLAHESGGVVVNEPFARRFDVAAGATVELETPAGVVRRRVEGVYRDYSGHIGRVVLDLDAFLAIYPDEGPRSVSIFVDTDGEIEGARSKLAAAFMGRFAVEILNNGEVRADVLRVFERTFAVTIALQIISSIVAAIAVVAVLTALIHERRRELAVVRVLGGSRAQLFGLVLGQALLLGLAGALGGLLVGLVVGYLLVTVVNVQSFGWTLQFVVPGSIYLTLVAVVPACLIAGIVPAVFALRSTPRESLHASV